jgi:hypothetical protein
MEQGENKFLTNSVLKRADIWDRIPRVCKIYKTDSGKKIVGNICSEVCVECVLLTE